MNERVEQLEMRFDSLDEDVKTLWQELGLKRSGCSSEGVVVEDSPGVRPDILLKLPMRRNLLIAVLQGLCNFKNLRIDTSATGLGIYVEDVHENHRD
jgi:hypothetical protein